MQNRQIIRCHSRKNNYLAEPGKNEGNPENTGKNAPATGKNPFLQFSSFGTFVLYSIDETHSAEFGLEMLYTLAGTGKMHRSVETVPDTES